MKTITLNTEVSFRELGSKFLGFLFYCENESDFRQHLEKIKMDYSDASHHCYGYRIDPTFIIEFSSDDGEPSGTAGLPILNQLKSFDVMNAGLVVVRYFGGTKLGKPGLISAYGEAAKLCLESASFSDIKHVQLFSIEYPYSSENLINKLINDYDLSEQSAEYLENVTKIFACPIEISTTLKKELINLKYLNINFEKLKVTFIIS